MVPAHTHRCRACGHEWECLFVNKPKAERCGVDEASRVNGEGPVCALCLHVEMAQRYAQARGYALTVNWPPSRGRS